MRKYIATVSQILDLQNNDVEWLANHLGAVGREDPKGNTVGWQVPFLFFDSVRIFYQNEVLGLFG